MLRIDSIYFLNSLDACTSSNLAFSMGSGASYRSLELVCRGLLCYFLRMLVSLPMVIDPIKVSAVGAIKPLMPKGVEHWLLSLSR
jgi:hypothetical protein